MKEAAEMGLIGIFSALILFHLLVLLQLIPFKMVWGGRLKTVADMYRFEAVSLILNAVFLFVILAKAQFLSINIPATLITISLWLMAGLFLLNTIGNLLSKNKMEKIIFTPLTMLLALLCLVLAIVK